MFLQKKLGTNFFLPKILRPNYYNYKRNPESLDEKDDRTCPICFDDLSLIESSCNETKGTLVSEEYMQTPCGHKFHPTCLKKWMDEKF